MDLNGKINDSGDIDRPSIIKISKSGHVIERIKQISEIFIEKYEKEPEFFVRVPGRVNLIGEHIDYCGYAVCPMAIKQDILLAVRSSENSVLRLTNSDPRYHDFETKLEDLRIDISSGPPQWYSYFLCGVRGVLETEMKAPERPGFLVAVTGNIPPSSGLSSSSALVCAAALCTAHCHQLTLSRRELASLSAKSERYIGTEGGGMDQAIAFLGTKGCAKLIEFNPLRDTNVKLPNDAVFVISHSLVEMNKAATADFNCRVVECRLASQVLAKQSGLIWEKLTRLSDLHKQLGFNLEEMAHLVKANLHEAPYTKQEICQILETTEENLNELTLSENTRHLKEFKLYQRALHVFQEAWRVREFCRKCEKGTDLETLGTLMKASHDSLRDLYQCSHLDLDKLVSIGGDLVAGARLTGAGWGGCAVALTNADKVDAYINALKLGFYASNPTANGKVFEHLVFQTEPQDGATVILNQSED